VYLVLVPEHLELISPLHPRRWIEYSGISSHTPSRGSATSSICMGFCFAPPFAMQRLVPSWSKCNFELTLAVGQGLDRLSP